MFSLKHTGPLLWLFLFAATTANGQTLVTTSPTEVKTEMFQAWEGNLIDVRYIAIDPTRGNLLIENLQDHTMLVTLPPAFAAKPVLGQFGVGQNGGGQFGGNQGGGGGAQSVGGNAQGGNQGGVQGFGNGAQGNGGFGQGLGNNGGNRGGFMRIPPGKTMRRTAVTVCLNHGLADPRPAMKYQVVPIDEVTDDPVVTQLCARLGGDALDPKSVQAAVWNRANGIPWDDLASMPAHRSRYLPAATLFSSKQLDQARLVIDGLVMEADLDDDQSQSSESTETNAPGYSAPSGLDQAE